MRNSPRVEIGIYRIDVALSLKYRLYCGKDGKTIVRYDNETGKDDHRHVGPQEMETSYVFLSLVQLLNDFAQDVARLSGEIK